MRCCPVCYSKVRPTVYGTATVKTSWKSSIRFSVGIADLDAIMQAVSLCNTMKKR